jgi:DNA repair photolyase
VDPKSGKSEGLPYSLSRWTDLPAAKWDWFERQLDQGWMVGFDPRTAVPSKWSLKPEDTYGLIFWTRNPRNLIDRADRLKDYPLVVHFTLTGWHEVEHGAPGLGEGLLLLAEAVDKFGPERVVWRFSPVPIVEDTLERFSTLAARAKQLGINEVYVSFLQENDRVPELRPRKVRMELLRRMAAQEPAMTILICNDDSTFKTYDDMSVPANLRQGVCEDGKRFGRGERPPFEGCGCSLAVDPFTINEGCTMGCEFCYAADKSLSPAKRNTTGEV